MGILEEWFEENQRDFPWRRERTPYRVWISEVMLQQTRASVVLPYFERWMGKFPNVKQLYKASLEEVMKAWEGLGYYSRARCLHRAAGQIVEEFQGEIPDDAKQLRSICGFGPYITGAVLSFGFQRRAVAMDGNVIRVIARLFSLEENVSRGPVRREIERLADSILDEKKPWVTMEALIELGATVCTPNPKCSVCPLRESCRSFAKGVAEYLPIKNATLPTTRLMRSVFVVENEGYFLVRKVGPGNIMAGLYEFPYEEGKSKHGSGKVLLNRAEEFLGEKVSLKKRLKEQSHSFTRFKAHLFPVWVTTPSRFVLRGAEWVHRSCLDTLPFSAGHRRILSELMEGHS